MLFLLKVTAACFLFGDVQVSKLDGVSVTGDLQSLDEDQLVLSDSDAKPVTIAIDDILKVEFGKVVTPAAQKDVLSIILNDSSSIPTKVTTSTATQVIAESTLLGEVTVPRESVQALILRQVKADWEPQWLAFLARSNKKDMLVVEKRDGSGLDFLAGVVVSVNDSNVPFLLDGSEIPVPRKRIVGVVFAKPEEPAGVSTGIAIELHDGAIVRGQDAFLEDGKLSFEASWQQFMEVDIAGVASIDFSSGRLHFLSDLEPIEEKYFGLEPPGQEWGTQFEADRSTRTGLSSLWRMSKDRFPNSGRPPLTLRGQRFRKGLCIFPSAKIEYALDGKYSSLKSLVGVDDDVALNQQEGRKPTAVELRIEADGVQVFKTLISAVDDPLPIDLKLTGVNTLSLFVDFGDGSSVCDFLDLADARLIVDTSAK